MDNDIGRLGFNVLGNRDSYSDHNIDVIIHGESCSVGFYQRPTFATSPLTPPLGTSTPTYRPHISDFKSPVDAGSSYRRPISTIEDFGMKMTFKTYPPEVSKQQQNTSVIHVHRSKNREDRRTAARQETAIWSTVMADVILCLAQMPEIPSLALALNPVIHRRNSIERAIHYVHSFSRKILL
ncbi:hypothetical protein GCK72_022983 [Caenorhabditis remanei]|uniref:Uncharacterized protein n=1 Tax=Caenorhabditis remanei TaxID=31234 RepID=A0A6A5FVC6_CAERE|nr:hypothetical protein GCK72_022983 [Caenorhabditis remanei]KAF1746527.1 hypothetical protein GCK72_022983 [Caenorhabditis remanei]